MVLLTRPSAQALDELLSESKVAALTYSEVGATSGDMPAGYRHDSYVIRLGNGEGVFSRAVEALRGWRAQVGAGVGIVPPGAWVDDGETVVLVIRTAGLWTTAPCRVVYVTEEANHFAFGYGTLPGHPEMGEAAFVIERGEADDVMFRVNSFSRTVDPLARLGAPITRRIQRRVTRRYLVAMAEAVS